MIKLSPNFMDSVTFGPLVVKNQNCISFCGRTLLWLFFGFAWCGWIWLSYSRHLL